MAESPSPAAPAGSTALPRVWLLLGNRAGDRAQVEALGAALAGGGWTCEAKRIVANGLFRIPNLLLDSSLLSIDRAASSPLDAPWPDLVIAAGRRSVPAARWIRRKSGGRTRLVHVGRPWAPLAWFDLLVTTAQYGLPERENLILNSLPLSPLGQAATEEAARRWADRLTSLPRPWTAVLVGGEARPYRLDRSAAAQLGRAASALARAAGGSLLVSTSPRTPAEAADALAAVLTVPHHLHRWQAGADNPYPAFLALADQFIVTGDSASMLAEACAKGRPVQIFALPERPDFRLKMARAFRRLAERNAAVRACYRRLVELGLLTSTRDMAALHAMLHARGLAAPLGGEPVASDRPVQDELTRTVAQIRALLEPAEAAR